MQPILVTKAEAGQKLLNFLERRLENAGSEIHKWLRTGQVRRNSGRCKAFDRVEEGDAIRVPPFAVLRGGALPAGRLEGQGKKPVGLGIEVVFEDDDLLVLNKPAGLPVQGGTGHKDSVAQRLKDGFADADFVPAPAHRLDKDTSGLLVVGKTYAALRGLTDALAGRAGESPRKEYLAWVWGQCPWHEEVELCDTLHKDEALQRVKTMAAKGNAEGKEARALAQVLEQREVAGRIASLLRIRILTGRTHQIRVQLSSRGFAVVGDPLYGDGREGLKLHAFSLAIPCFLGRAEPIHLKKMPIWPAPWIITD